MENFIDEDHRLSFWIIQYETGKMTSRDLLRFFSYLIQSGKLGKLSSPYKIKADLLIRIGQLSIDGDIKEVRKYK